MPIQYSTFQLPGGAQCVRADCSGSVTREEADFLIKQGDPGGPMHGLPILALTQKMASITADARGLSPGAATSPARRAGRRWW